MISNGGHVIGVPVTSKAYGIEEVSPREPSFRKVDADHLEAVRVSDLGAKAVGDGEGEAEPGRNDPAGRRDRALVPAVVLGRERRAAGEGAAVLPLHHRRAHRRDAVRLHCTKKIAFRSDRPVAVTSPNGDVAQVPYRVVIPLMRIAKVRPSENVNKPEEKYIQVVTVDGFEFWFMGFVSYQRSCKYMQQAISELQ